MNTDKELMDLLGALEDLAFRQREKLGEQLIEIYTLRVSGFHKEFAEELLLLQRWFITPYSFWPADFLNLAICVCKRLKEGRGFDRKLRLFFKLLRDFPPDAVQTIVSRHEHGVQKGEYDQWVRSNAKFLAYEQRILADPELQKEWEEIKAQFPPELLARMRNKRGVIRRRMVCERNFRIDWELEWDDEEGEFQAMLDALCYRWDLYGMEFDKPLLLKLTVTPTPFGLLIMIPKYFSADFIRDLDRSVIREYQKGYGVPRQGSRLASIQQAREERIERLMAAEDEAKRRKLTGDAKYRFIIDTAGLASETDDGTIRRDLRNGKKKRAGNQ